MNISLEGNFDDSAADMASMMARLRPVLDEATDRKWKLKCSQCRYLGPWAAGLLASTFLMGRLRSQKPRVQLPSEPLALAGFCRFSGLEKLCCGGAPPDDDHPDNETLALQSFRDANWNIQLRLIRLLKRHIELDPEVEEHVSICVSEMVQNVVDHSQSPIGGVMCARWLRQAREVRVSIVDRGVGIEASLRGRHPQLSGAADAITRVIQGGHSALSRKNNKGEGIRTLFSIVRLVQGRIALFSGSGQAEWKPGMPSPLVTKTSEAFPGTAVFFALPTNPT